MLSNTILKHINALKIKKYRNKYSEFIAEGEKIISELIQEGLTLKYLFSTEKIASHFVQKYKVSSELLTICSTVEMNKLSTLQHHYECLAVFAIPNPNFEPESSSWILALDDIQDPGNMGTIIRSCDWFGIKTILCSLGCVDAYNPKVIQASMASIGRVQVLEMDLEDFIRKSYLPVYGAVLDGSNFSTISFAKKGIILIGNEGHGIHTNLLELITQPITIPRIGKAESLNAAIATTLILEKATFYEK